jgi:tetratricopeptide (TPR) repeat protein
MVKEMTDRAEALRKRRQYGEAAALYEAAWQKEASPYVARWLIYCRRKTGDLDGAAAFATTVLDRYPDHSYLRTEYAWVFYDGKIKEAKESGDLRRLIAHAEETLGLSADELLVARVAQAVVKLAKGQPQPPWEVIAEWAAMINPERLSDGKRTTGEGKTFMSEREEWFVGLARALMETGRYGEARGVAQDGLKQFPFIKPDGGGEAVFVALRDLPPECVHAGARVSFRLEESFDRKKNRASVRAAAVEPG